jgi:hypothetical protein
MGRLLPNASVRCANWDITAPSWPPELGAAVSSWIVTVEVGLGSELSDRVRLVRARLLPARTEIISWFWLPGERSSPQPLTGVAPAGGGQKWGTPSI